MEGKDDNGMKDKDTDLVEPVYFRTVLRKHYIAGRYCCSGVSSILVQSHPLICVHHSVNQRNWDSGSASKLRIQSWCLTV